MERQFDNRRFGGRVRAEMKRQGLSQRQAAELMHVEKSTLGRVVSGYTPTIENYLRILRWLVPVKFSTMYGEDEDLK